MKKDLKPLEPADPNRCQAEKIVYKPFTIGGSVYQTTRCDNQPAYIATENKPGKDGQIGSMSLCPACAEEFKKKFGENYATLVAIKAVGAK